MNSKIIDRRYGSGSIFKRARGRIWYLQFWINGKQHGPYSSRSTKREDAEAILEGKLAEAERAGATIHPNRFLPITGCLTSTIGAAAELLVCSDLMNKGFEVFRALSQHASCDMIALLNGRSIRIEVKTGNLTKDMEPMVSIQRQKGRFDVLAVVNRDHGIIYRPRIETLTSEAASA